MDIATLFGLQADPLVVHIPIVLIPLVGMGTVAVALSAGLRQRIGWIVVALAGLPLAGVQLAVGSGEAFEHSVPRSRALAGHVSLAGSMRPLALLLFVAVLGLMTADRYNASLRRPRWLAVTGMLAATWQRVQIQPLREQGAGLVARPTAP